MATLTIKIRMENAAFGDGDLADRNEEVDRILRSQITGTVYRNGLDAPLYDTNGNHVGYIRVSKGTDPMADDVLTFLLFVAAVLGLLLLVTVLYP